VGCVLTARDPHEATFQNEMADNRSRVQGALDFLFARTAGGYRFGLERTREFLAHLGNPHHRYRIFHVAGTNGKGSSVATMEALLREPGRVRRIGRYTSPHLVDFRERMVVDGRPIPADDIVAFIDQHITAIQQIGASFFEATTAMAFDYFSRANVDVALVEAGLGGRLDSTNVVDPVVAGVTSIGFDHTEYLGNTLEEIAREKAGIFKAGRPAVIGERDHSIRTLLADAARTAGASAVHVVAEESELRDIRVNDTGTQVTLTGFGEPLRLQTPLTGRHQAANLAFAMAMIDAAGPEFQVTPSTVGERLARVEIPGRFQRIGPFIFDVAHNPDGAEVVAQTMVSVRPPEPVVVVLCVLRDKDWREMIRVLRPIAQRFIVTMAPTAPASRAWSLDDVMAFTKGEGIFAESIADFDAALSRARDVGETVLITGSFHTVGDAMARLQVSPLAG
jgi:dihydrofolate synthase/folylpolyglutamate synthase